MMPWSTIFIILVAALLIGNIFYCSAENVYCVTPTASSCSSCPQNIHCATLSEYAQEAGKYFTSNTTIVFLPGDHTLDTNITVANVAKLTMHGQSTSGDRATVVCSGSVGFCFMSMVDFKIDYLAFRSCSRRYIIASVIPDIPRAIVQVALLLQSTWYAELINCSFYDNIDASLAVNDTNITLSGNIEFIHNHVLCRANNIGVGGIIALDSNLTFTGNTTFLDNNASCSAPSYQYSAHDLVASSGGAIYTAGHTLLCFNGTNNFINNSATYGGAIYTSNNTVIRFYGTSNFINNSAGGAGGAIITSDKTVLSFNGISTFINNSADDGGGAISTLGNTVLSFNGTSNFINNTAGNSGGGGAISTSDNTVLSFIGNTNFISNLGYWSGGAISTSDNTVLNFSGTNNFINNYAEWSGGAIIVLKNSLISFTGTSSFINNSAGSSGGTMIISEHSVLSFNGITYFIRNSAVHEGGPGGVFYTSDNSVLSFSGVNNFTNNSAGGAGGAIITSDNTVLRFSGTSNFINNSASWDGGGAIVTHDNTILTFNGTNNFINNIINTSATYFGGGALSTYDNTILSLSGTSNFINNSANHGGGAIITADNTTLTFNGTSNFISNSAGHGGGAIFTYNTVLNFSGTSNFINNKAGSIHGADHSAGGAIAIFGNTVLSFKGSNNFINNSAGHGGGAIFTNNIVLNFSGNSNFINNSAALGGAIYADTNSALTFNDTIYFINNGHYKFEGGVDTLHGYTNGGGVYMGFKSNFSILRNTNVYWENNHATLGGAIYVRDGSPISYCAPLAPYVPQEECFFQLPGQNVTNGIDVQLVFKNNFADITGSVIYGGAIDNCKLTHGLDSHSSGKVFNQLVHIDDDINCNTTSSISSDPLYICTCEHYHPDCRYSWYIVPRTVHPGETFQVSVVAVGQRNGAVPSTVISSINQIYNPGDKLDSQYLERKTSNTCTTLNYAVFSLSQNVEIDLHSEGTSCDDKTLALLVNLNQTCPPGFSISDLEKSCICEPRLAQYGLKCNITNGLGQITRDSTKQIWVGYDRQSNEVILHIHCPFGYCVSHPVIFPLNDSDIQCAYNRSALLCGRCKEGYSLVLGTSQCKKCTNEHLAFIILFALMGLLLVILLLVSKLTVATGTLSGLVLYANILGVNRTIFLPVESIDFFSVFLAWLNLDFGIETCFYNGMDVYSKTWLQFVFPVFIWMLIGLLICISSYSRRFTRLLGNNPVSVLATLILLSYTKILRTLITVFYITYLEYPTYNRTVWLYDANIDYLTGKHIPLFLVALIVFLFLFLPYTLLLLFGPWLQTISHLRLFSWVNSARLKSFMDSYHAPYKANHRYWPGLLLVLRFVLLLVFALNPQQDQNINLLGLGQWWSLQELVSRCSGRFI